MNRTRSTKEATGGLTEKELAKLSEHHAIWVARASRTNPIDTASTSLLIRDLYSAASLSAPVVSVVSSPGVMAFAGAFARHILSQKSKDEKYAFALPEPNSLKCHDRYKEIVNGVLKSLSNVTAGFQYSSAAASEIDVCGLTLAATYELVDVQIAEAMDRPTSMDIRERLDSDPLRDMEIAIVNAMKDPFGNSAMTDLIQSNVDGWGFELARTIFPNEEDAATAIDGVCDWWKFSQGGAADTYWVYCITAARDVLGLHVPGYKKFRVWEECTMHSAYRYMSVAYCLACDFPSRIECKNLNYADGSGQNYYHWSDGWSV